MENGFTSPRHDAFPAGLRVLVVDDDPTWLKILEKMLKKCSYEVTTCGLARDALNLLRERKDGYDIVISDVNMPDMDGFKLLEHVGLEMDLPVIMMSVDGETSRVMKGVQHGACDYLLKPIRMKELRNIWQHVFRKRIHDLRDIEGHEGIDSLQMTRSGSDRSDDGFFFCGEDITSGKKRKDVETNHEKDFADPSSSAKKARVVWSVDLHQKFVKAVNQIGFDKVGPKKILDLMNVPWLTRENVASHLQKYRLYLSRLQKDNDLKPCFGGIKHSDTTPQDPQASFNSQNAAVHQTDIPSGNYAFSSDGLLLQERKKAHEDDPKGIFPMPKEEPQRPLVADLPDQQESRGLQIGLKGFPHLDSEVRYRKLDPTVPTHYSWRAVPETPFKEENDAIPLADFRPLPMSGHVQVPQRKPTDPSINPQQSRTEGARTNSSDYNKPLHAGHRSKNYTQANPLRTRSGSLCVQDKAHVVNYQDFSSTTIKAGSMENVGFNLSCLTDTEFSQRNLPSISGSSFTSSNEDVLSGWLQNDAFPVNLGLHNIEFSGYNDPCFVAEAFPIGLYDPLRFDYEQLTEPTECSVLDQGLFMA